MSRITGFVVSLAIIIPLLGIAALLVYFDVIQNPLSSYTAPASTVDAADVVTTPLSLPVVNNDPATSSPDIAATSLTVVDDDPAASSPDPDANPLQPLGPKASDRVTPGYSGGGGCSSCG
ncbi:MAG: hypothetical protein M0R22_06105 [Dehalococcoidia bacterium]|jgi:hypothetical protein|nr:hypothetical protein [Dehalococcoidia bacterium]